MAIKTYRYRRTQAVDLQEIGRETDRQTLAFVAATTDIAIDLAIEEKFKDDLDESMASRGYEALGEPATPIKPDIRGSRGNNVALANLLTVLASQNIITDSTTN